jgi:hypothetical protein
MAAEEPISGDEKIKRHSSSDSLCVLRQDNASHDSLNRSAGSYHRVCDSRRISLLSITTNGQPIPMLCPGGAVAPQLKSYAVVNRHAAHWTGFSQQLHGSP